MRLIFIYGPVAAGKLTIGRLVADRTGMALFHNHLVVDAVASVFPFGSQEFRDLRETFWLDTMILAAKTNRSLVFTFAPEPTVAADFPHRLAASVAQHGGRATFIALTIDHLAQEQRIDSDDRRQFGKLRSVSMLRDLRPAMEACMQAMPTPLISIDTGTTTASAAADAVIRAISN